MECSRMPLYRADRLNILREQTQTVVGVCLPTAIGLNWQQTVLLCQKNNHTQHA